MSKSLSCPKQCSLQKLLESSKADMLWGLSLHGLSGNQLNLMICRYVAMPAADV